VPIPVGAVLRRENVRSYPPSIDTPVRITTLSRYIAELAATFTVAPLEIATPCAIEQKGNAFVPHWLSTRQLSRETKVSVAVHTPTVTRPDSEPIPSSVTELQAATNRNGIETKKVRMHGV
jgi:hypothetical protein